MINIFKRVELSKPPNITFAIGLCISFSGKSPVIANGINAKAVVKAVIKIGFSLSKDPLIIVSYKATPCLCNA